MLPHLLVVGAGNSGDPGPAGRGRRLSGEHSGGCAARSGRRSGVAAATFGVLLNTARSDGIEYQKRREAFKSPCMDRGPQGSAVQWVAAAADRVRCGEAYGSRPQPPQVFWRHRLNTSRRETGRSRPSRRRPQCCGRGEAAGNCVNAAGAFLTAPVDRVPQVLGTRAASAPEFLLRPGSAGRTEHDYKTRMKCREEHSRGRAATRGRRRHRVLPAGIGDGSYRAPPRTATGV
jgi:hypothetical protein